MEKLYQYFPVRVVMLAENVYFLLMSIAVLPLSLVYFLARSSHTILGLDSLEKMQLGRKLLSIIDEDKFTNSSKWVLIIQKLSRRFTIPHILDAGCGRCEVLQSISKSRAVCFGIDLDGFALHQGKSSTLAVQGDIQVLPWPDFCFDLVYSINSFEHYSNPELCLDELMRVLKPGGILYAAFSPLYFSPMGLHAQRRLGFAYPQLLFNDVTLDQYIQIHADELTGTYDNQSKTNKIGPYLNKYDFVHYRRLFRRHNRGYRLLSYVEKMDLSGIPVLLQYMNIIKDKAPSFKSLLTSGIKK